MPNEEKEREEEEEEKRRRTRADYSPMSGGGVLRRHGESWE